MRPSSAIGSRGRMKRWIGICAVWASLLGSAGAQTNGIFADFATSLGDFTVWLDHARAPRAVASFVGLATGETGWLDEQSNVWHRPFYDGSLFHRVVKDAQTNGIAIQGGGRIDRDLATVYEPRSISTNRHWAMQATINPVGIITNVVLATVRTTNAPAVATNYVTGTNAIVTNAPMVTYAVLSTKIVSSNAAGSVCVTNASVSSAVFTNFSLTAQVTTNYSQTAVVTTNASGSNMFFSHGLEIEEVSSAYLPLKIEITNFVGPGYAMLENVTNGLAHSNGVISMANSGPNTDGSQFFIATTDVPYWDGGYSVFGHVVSGMPVATAIAAVAVQGSGARPVVDVVLSNVVIRRVGAAAEAFDVAAQGIPAPESAPMAVYRSGSNLAMEIQVASQTKPLMFSESPDMRNWEHGRYMPASVDFYTNADQILTGSIPLASLGDKYFFHASHVRYPVSITAPASQRGRTFTFKWDDPDLTYSVTFTTNLLPMGAGWVEEGTNAPVARTVFMGNSWTRDAYMGRLNFMDDLAREYSYNLGFNPGQPTNRFAGTWGVYGSGMRYAMSGTFTWE